MVALVIAACSPERTTTLDQSYVERIVKHPNVVVTAPKELIGATLTINGNERRMLWADTLIDRPRWMFWRRMLGLREPRPSAARAYLELPPGTHVLAITHMGYRKIVKIIELRREQQQVRVTAAEVIDEKDSVANAP
jgi:hypothetical protein